MLTNEQINTIHRLHFVENWTVRKIARHLHIGRRTVAKYLIKPAQAPLHRTRTSKLDPFKPAIDEWLNRILRLPLRSSFNGYAIRRSEEHTSELQSRLHLVCRLLLEKKKKM